jgi:hypothetical protein
VPREQIHFPALRFSPFVWGGPAVAVHRDPARGRHSILAIREVSVTQKEAPCRRGVDHHDCEAFQGAIAETLISGYSTSPTLVAVGRQEFLQLIA